MLLEVILAWAATAMLAAELSALSYSYGLGLRVRGCARQALLLFVLLLQEGGSVVASTCRLPRFGAYLSLVNTLRK